MFSSIFTRWFTSPSQNNSVPPSSLPYKRPLSASDLCKLSPKELMQKLKRDEEEAKEILVVTREIVDNAEKIQQLMDEIVYGPTKPPRGNQ